MLCNLQYVNAKKKQKEGIRRKNAKRFTNSLVRRRKELNLIFCLIKLIKNNESNLFIYSALSIIIITTNFNCTRNRIN